MEKTCADVILFAGQSNMQGQTERLLDDSVVENAYEYRLLTDCFVPLRDPVGEDVCRDGTVDGESHPEMSQSEWLERYALGRACYGHSSMVPSFCRAYEAAAGCTVLAVHVAKGSTQAMQWLPGTDGYAVLLKKSKAALALARQQYKVRRVCLVWLQGESDAIAAVPAQLYREQLKELNAALRDALALERFGIIRVGSFTGTSADVEIQTAQEELCAQEDGFVMLTRMTAELEQDPQGMNPFVKGHFSAQGLARLGAAAGTALAEV